MKNLGISILALATGLAALILHFTGKDLKVGYAETSVLMSEFSEALKARSEFEAAQKEWDANLKALNDSLMATIDRMKVEYDKAPAAGKEVLRNLLQKRNDDLQRYTNAVKKMSMDKEKELMDPVVRKLNSHLDAWGKRNGYDMILGTMTGGNILQANAEYNVTSWILKDLNETYKDLPAAESAAKTGGRTDSAERIQSASAADPAPQAGATP